MNGRSVAWAALGVVLGAALTVAGCVKSATGGATTGCPTGQTACGSACVNVTSDPQNCGGCGTACGTGRTCQNGACQCAAGQMACGSACVSVASDPQNCGACGTVCGSGQTCQSSACQCESGSLSCGGICVSSDATHCGNCTTSCASGQVCSGGACSSSCATGATACPGGACVVTNGNDALNCGGCGTVCPAGAVCSSGACGCSGAGQMLCASGCVDTSTSTANCGSCGHACAPGQTCTSGGCTGGGTAGTTGTGGGTAGATGAGGLGGAAGAAGRGGTTGTAGTTGAGGRGGTTGTAGTTGAGGTTGTGGSAGAAGPRVNLNFDTDWKYNKGDVTGADAKAFVDSSWGYVDLPHTPKFNTPDDISAYAGISWYRKHFTVAASYQGSKLFIEFGAAMQLADVWVNGTHKITHQGGYAPFTIDVTADVTTGGADNVISVKLDSRANSNWPPGMAAVDFQYHGGLYRHVTMHVTNPLHVTDAVYANKIAGGGLFVTYPSASTSSAMVSIKTNVINEATASKSATVVSQILDANGQMVGSTMSTASIAAGANSDFTHTITVANPKLWHPNSPVLYTLVTTVQDGSTAVDSLSTKIGIRRIQITHSGGLVINGARFKALGLDLHEETYGLGNAIPDQAYYFDVKRIRDAGLTFVRTSHYPHSPAFYDACDALGVLVMDAETGWQYYNSATAFVNATYQDLRDLIHRDRNHPSVIIWEASLNESSFTDAWAQMAHSIVHAEYPGDQAFSAQWLFTHADIFIDASQHDVRSSTDTRPILIDEYGDWDYGGFSSTSRQSREAGDAAMLTQANNVQDGQGKNLALSWFTADGYWLFADYAGVQGLSRSGLFDMYRLPKFAYYFMQSQRDPSVTVPGVDSGPTVFIANFWMSSSPTTVRVFGNCDQVSLYLNGTLSSTRSPDSGTGLMHPPFNFNLGSFTAGTLRADCLIGGTVRATFTRQTPGSATALRLRPEGTTLRADLGDARLVFVDVVDANGSVVPGDSHQVSLSVSGPATLVGPTTITMKGGQLAAWVRPTRVAGSITLTASASGLTSASTTLTSQAVAGLPAAPSDRP